MLRLTNGVCDSAETDTAYDQVPLCPLHIRQDEVQPAEWTLRERGVWSSNCIFPQGWL